MTRNPLREGLRLPRTPDPCSLVIPPTDDPCDRVEAVGNHDDVSVHGQCRLGFQLDAALRNVANAGRACDALEADEVVRSALPGDMYRVFMHYKRDEWERHCAQVSDWDVQEYLDVLP